MNLRQSARYKAYALALAHLADNQTIISNVPAITQVCADAKKLLEEVAAADNLRQQNSSAITAGKWQFRDELAQLALIISSAIVSYAAGNNNQQLQLAMAFTPTELFRSRDHELGAKAANILTQAQVIATELKAYGITDMQMNSFATMVSEYAVAYSAPRKTAAERKQAGNAITEKLNALRDIFKLRIDKMMMQFKGSHPEFYNQYQEKRTVVDPVTRKTQVSGTVLDAATQAPIPGVRIEVQDTPLATTSQADGSFLLSTPMVTQGILHFQKEGYAPATVQLEARRGYTTRLDVELKQQ